MLSRSFYPAGSTLEVWIEMVIFGVTVFGLNESISFDG